MRISLYVYRLLVIFLIFLAFAFVVGTIYVVFVRVDSNAALADSNAAPIQQIEPGGELRTFTGIGRMRISTADPNPGVVIIFISFVFDPNDRPFSEELALKVRDFREIIIEYIGSFSINELHNKDEEDIKNELLHRFNTILRLGQLETLFFSDFMIL